MRNYLQTGDVVTIPAPSAVSSGDGVLVGTLFGVAATESEPGDDVAIKTTGVFTLPKTSGAGVDCGRCDLLGW